MTNSCSNIPCIVVQDPEVKVEFDTSDISSTTIGTSDLGPCIGITIEFIVEDQQKCIIDHYAYGSYDEKLPPREALNWFLNDVLNLMQDHLKFSAHVTIDLLKKSMIRELSILITGGDIRRGKFIRDICSQCFSNNLHLDRGEFTNAELFCLFETLQKKVIVLKPDERKLNSNKLVTTSRSTSLNIQNDTSDSIFP